MIKLIEENNQDLFNKAVSHPLQSWEWGDFRIKLGQKVVRFGIFDKENIVEAYQVTFHKIPHTKLTVGYLPKSRIPSAEVLEFLKKLGRENKAVFIKLEPNIILRANRQLAGSREVLRQVYDTERGRSAQDQKFSTSQVPDGTWQARTINDFLKQQNLRNGKSLFTKFNSLIDLNRSEDEILKSFKQKTRYNIKIAEKHGVKIQEDNSPEAFEAYLKLLFETTKRQGFYAHNEKFHRLQWGIMKSAGISHLLTATYQGKILAAHLFFVFNKTLYYPYGASTRESREVMAPTLLMWEAIRFGKKLGCTSFDLWGDIEPNPSPDNPYFGFHRFKEGFSPEIVEYIGTYDLVINPVLYQLYNVTDKVRWKILKIKSHS